MPLLTANVTGHALDRGLLISTPVHGDTGDCLTAQQDRHEVEFKLQRDDPYLSVVNFSDPSVDGEWLCQVVLQRAASGRCFLATLPRRSRVDSTPDSEDVRGPERQIAPPARFY